MIDLKVDVRAPKIKFNAPDDPRFWTAIATETQKTVRKRTEKDGQDAADKGFKSYSTAYKEFRESKGRSGKPNLSFTSRMLSSMKAIGRKGEAIVRLTGEQGFKAWVNEKSGRVFFALSESDMNRVFKDVSKWISRHNNLK